MNQNIRIRNMSPLERHDLAVHRQRQAEMATELAEWLDKMMVSTLELAAAVGIDVEEIEG